jgi:hypothetical protein
MIDMKIIFSDIKCLREKKRSFLRLKKAAKKHREFILKKDIFIVDYIDLILPNGK